MSKSLDSEETITNRDFYFKKKDYNFTGYSNEKLKELLENNILITTEYPKLILILLSNTTFCTWYSKSKTSLINILVKTITEYEKLYNCEIIEINNILFWKIFTMIYFNSIENDKEDSISGVTCNQKDIHEKNVTKKVDFSMNLQHNTRKKGMRSIWIS